MDPIQAATIAGGISAIGLVAVPLLGTLYYSAKDLYRTFVQYESYRR